jgi:hypothetical protein
MEQALFIVMAGLTWAIHAGLYAYYAPRFRDMIRTARFVLLHSLEAAAVFGIGYGAAIKLVGDFASLELLAFAGVITALFDSLTFVFLRKHFRGLLSPANIIVPVLAAGGAIYGMFILFS